MLGSGVRVEPSSWCTWYEGGTLASGVTMKDTRASALIVYRGIGLSLSFDAW